MQSTMTPATSRPHLPPADNEFVVQQHTAPKGWHDVSGPLAEQEAVGMRRFLANLAQVGAHRFRVIAVGEAR